MMSDILWGPYSNNMTAETLDLYGPLLFYGFEGGGPGRLQAAIVIFSLLLLKTED